MKMVFGSETTVISLTATLNNAENTYSGLANCTTTQLDNSLLYPYARAVLHVPDTMGGTPTVGATVDLFMVLDDIDGTSDETPEPAASDIVHLATYVGSFVVDNQDVAYRKPIVIDLHGVEKARFFIKNNTGVSLTYSSNAITVKIKPFSYEPAAS